MLYVSTRGEAEPLAFGEVLLEGLATDGGLFVPETWPALSDLPPGTPYADAATEIMWPFVEGSLERPAFAELVANAYAAFDHPDVVPMRRLDDDLWLCELFHGPTFAFKDVALQLVGRLFDQRLRATGRRATIVGATSGDTGSAAIHACSGSEALDIIVLHPAGRVSETQRRQMTTVEADNVHNLAIEGSFDDCQRLVKQLFADRSLRADAGLAAVNSINWARIMAQIVYYVTASVTAGDGSRFVVPTGNFGNIFAGYAARRMGAPLGELVVATNANDILARFFADGTMESQRVVPTLSPSMDIQVSSNFERLLFELVGRDSDAVVERMERFGSDGRFSLNDDRFRALSDGWGAERVDDDETLATIASVHSDHGFLIDPHTAVAVTAARRRGGSPTVVLSTAHPAKFPDAVRSAIGTEPETPPALAVLEELPEYYETIPGDIDELTRRVRAVAASG